MGGRLEGKIAVVTAAGQGIGRAIAEAYAAEGATVHASDRDAGKLDGLRGCRTSVLDVRSRDAIADHAAGIGGIDILVNVAGFVHHGTVLDTTEEDWDFTFAVNVKSMHRMIRAFLPGMLARAEAGAGAGGSIVNMASCASSLKGIPDRYVYGTTKAAVIGLTKAVAADFCRRRIRCNAICPGPVRSPSWEARVDGFAASLGSRERALDVYLAKQPMGRVGEPEEVGELAVYLGSDASAFMTGVALPLDGGLTL
jgi:2-keto-3-deoxy-L-fuconate dehydrogenase